MDAKRGRKVRRESEGRFGFDIANEASGREQWGSTGQDARIVVDYTQLGCA
jgi:hypothetical protein